MWQRLALSPFGLLVRHFFDRLFDTESLAADGDGHAGITQTLGILAVPSGFFVLVFRPLGLWGWQLAGVRYFFISLSMLVMGFVVVFKWDALFPDRRDYQILTPLPLPLSKLFLAKSVALAGFLGIFLIDVNFFGTLFWPGIDSGRNLANLFVSHAIAMLAAGLFAALSLASLHGILITILPGKLYRKASTVLQTLLMGGLVMLLFLTPLVGQAIRPLCKAHSPMLHWVPGFWFTGLYEAMRPATHDRELIGLGRDAVRALWVAAGVFVLTYLPFYRSHARRVLEEPAPSPSGPGAFSKSMRRLLGRSLLRHPTERAVFYFISQTIGRSTRHRLFLATYGGFGAALAVLTYKGGGSGALLRMPLMLSFVLVSGLRAAFNFPAELRANWSFQVSENGQSGQCVAATRKWIAVCAVLPLFLALAPVEFRNFPWLTAVFHLAYGMALSLVLVELLFFDFQKIPFTCSHYPGKVNMVFLGVIYIVGFTMYSGTMAGLEAWLSGSPLLALLFLVVTGLVCVAVNHLHREADPGMLDFEDAVDPVVRTLQITAE